jgi:hypothetical protein
VGYNSLESGFVCNFSGIETVGCFSAIAVQVLGAYLVVCAEYGSFKDREKPFY